MELLVYPAIFYARRVRSLRARSGKEEGLPGGVLQAFGMTAI
jgi:hypothetical protein